MLTYADVSQDHVCDSYAEPNEKLCSAKSLASVDGALLHDSEVHFKELVAWGGRRSVTFISYIMHFIELVALGEARRDFYIIYNMCVYMYICIYVYMYICTYIDTYICSLRPHTLVA